MSEHLTRDVHAATVYSQTWTYRANGNTVGFDVLALDPQMAEEMGGIALVGRDCTLMDWTLTANEPRPQASISRKLSILAIEEPECAELRERAYREREAA